MSSYRSNATVQKVTTRRWHYYAGPCDPALLSNVRIFAGSAHPELSKETAEYLGKGLDNIKLSQFKDGEVSIELLDTVEGYHCYVIQPVCRNSTKSVNDIFVETLLMISCMRRAAAKSVTLLLPYFGYARQDRKLSTGVPISASDVAQFLACSGVSRVICIDLHCGQIQGFFPPTVPVDNLSAGPVGATFFAEKQLQKPVVVSPDAGGVSRAKEFRNTLEQFGYAGKTGLAMIIKQRAAASVIDRMDLVGEVNGSDCIIVDDMTDTSGTLCEAARILSAAGAHRVFAFVAHGVLSPPAADRIRDSVLEQLVITNTVPLPAEFQSCDVLSKKVVVLSLAPLLAETISRLVTSRPLVTRPVKTPTTKL